jgi:tight adherence protein C
MPMLWVVTGTTFVLSALAALALVYSFTEKQATVAERLSTLSDPASIAPEQSFGVKQAKMAMDAAAALGRLMPATAAKQASKAQLMMIRAGYRSSDAIQVMRGLKFLSPIAFVALALLTGVYRFNPFLVLLIAAVIGWMLPETWLIWRIKVRQKRLRLGLPDGLDLLVICVEIGLGLDQSLMKVAQEMRVAHPELSDELQMVNLEMRVGKTRTEALRELARRTGSEEIKTLVAMLVQTERFGTSIAQSLRIHSDELRTRRRQRAEELSAKTTVKMVGPLVFFIFPALMVVILGPAVLTLVRQLMPALK